jgi:hypothetical protein
MGDLEAFADSDYPKLEFASPHRPRSRSQSPSASFRIRRMKYLYVRISFLIIAFLFMFSTIEHICNTSLFAQGLMSYITLGETLPFSSPPSPLVEQPQFRPWELTMSVSGVEEELTLIVEAADAGRRPSEAWIHRQEDTNGISQLRAAIGDRILNDTVIIIPVQARDWPWVINLSCRLSFLGQTNVVYWALDDDAAALLQAHNYPFYHNPLLHSHGDPNLKIDDARNKIRVWNWVLHTGVHLLYLEPTVALFHNPIEALTMDADIEAIISEASVNAATTITENGRPTLGTGAIWLRTTRNVHDFLDSLYELLDTGKYKDETDVLNSVLRDNPRQFVIANEIDNNPTGVTSNTGQNATTPLLQYRYVSPFYFVNHPIFAGDMQVQTSGYTSSFSLRETSGADELFYPTLVYIEGRDVERYELARTNGGDGAENKMVESWRNLGWWELTDEGKCSLLASLPHASYA